MLRNKQSAAHQSLSNVQWSFAIGVLLSVLLSFPISLRVTLSHSPSFTFIVEGLVLRE